MSDRYNLRTLYERIQALEARIEKLEVESVRFLEAEPIRIHCADRQTGLFTVAQRGPKWFCLSPEGVKLNERGLSKADAQKLADDMNGVTRELAPA